MDSQMLALLYDYFGASIQKDPPETADKKYNYRLNIPVTNELITGDVIATTGRFDSGYVIATTTGAWVGSDSEGPFQETRITGTPKFLVGEKPLDAGNNGYAVATTDGLFVSAVEEFIKINGIDGNIISISGSKPGIQSGGWIVATDTNKVYTGNLISKTTATELTGFTGTVQLVGGDLPENSTIGGYGIATTDGVWVGRGVGENAVLEKVFDGPIKDLIVKNSLDNYAILSSAQLKIKNGFYSEKTDFTAGNAVGIAGTLHSIYKTVFWTSDDKLYFISGSDPTQEYGPINGAIEYVHMNSWASNGYIVKTTDGFYISVSNSPLTKISGITGELISISGEQINSSSSGYIIATTDGVWTGYGNTTPTKLDIVTGTPLKVIGKSPLGSSGYMVATTDGIWIKGPLIPLQVTGLTGSYIDMEGESPNSSSYGYTVITSDGIWFGTSATNFTMYDPLPGSYKGMLSQTPYSAGVTILTSDGVWKYMKDPYTSLFSETKLSEITGVPIKIIGWQSNSANNQQLVATTTGLWFIDERNNSLVVKRVFGLSGDIKDMWGKVYANNGYAVSTTDGLYVGNETFISKVSDKNVTAGAGSSPMSSSSGFAFISEGKVYYGYGIGEKLIDITGGTKLYSIPNKLTSGYMVEVEVP